MKYCNGEEIKSGDIVIIKGIGEGRIVCDYDKRECLKGYESWLIDDELVAGGFLSDGVMIETKSLGFLHYPRQDEDISLISRNLE